ncbi:hypothetical protein PV350_13940 [Streptomyces sp. PA03-6a]|nr:hypothetical protein [Streptomyces sp. PA03-6a]
MAMTVGELMATFDLDTDPARRGIVEVERSFRGLQRETDDTLREMRGSFAREGEAMGRALGDAVQTAARASVAATARETTEGLERATRDAHGRLRDARGRFIRESEADGDRSGRGFGHRMLSSITSTVRSGISSAVEAGTSGAQRVTGMFSSNPYIGAVAAAFVAALVPAIGALMAAATISVAGIGVIGLGYAILKDEPEVKKAAGKLMETVKRIFSMAARPLIKPFVDAFKTLNQTVLDLTPQIGQAFQLAAPFIQPLTAGIDKLVRETVPGLLSLLRGGQPVFDGLGKSLGTIGEGLGGMFEIIGTQGPEAGQALSDIAVAIKGLLLGVGYTIAFLADAYGKIRTWTITVVDAFRWLYDVLIGHSIIPDLINGIASWFARLPGMVWSALSSFGSKIAGRAAEAGAAMLRTIRSKLSDAVTAVRGLPGRARDALGNLGSVLASAGSRLISGFISGIVNRFGDVRSTLNQLTGMLPDWKGPAARDAKILFSSGELVMKGFQAGIDAGTLGIRRQLGGLTDGLPSMVTPTSTAAYGARNTAPTKPQVIRLEGDGSAAADLVLSLMRNAVTTRGGDVQMVVSGYRTR